MWLDKIIDPLQQPQIINDSKTPSGRVHVGSLRGVLIHDALLRGLLAKGTEATFLYGVDDYDPMDGMPAEAPEEMRHYMGRPLCQVPAPQGSNATDMADHYISEFLEIFQELHVNARIYRMRDVYRSGRFNAAIDAILSQSALVRQIYQQVSGAQRPDDWHPFQVICQQCGKIGTTVVSAYDGQEVHYHCRPNLVKWAQGCGYQGKTSPFDGAGKLPWKLEWAAKWHTFAITLEGAGKDHCTKGGSRDIASAVLQKIFAQQPPMNVPYEFFLVSGAKMSSSKGIGNAAREMADFLPPEILRYLMIGSDPKKAVNFNTGLPYMSKLFNEFDRLLQNRHAGNPDSTTQQLLSLVETSADSTSYLPIPFQLISTLVQLPHIDLFQEVERQAPVGWSQRDRQQLQRRIQAARYWLDHFANQEDTFTIQHNLPETAHTLTASQRAFLHQLAELMINQAEKASGEQMQALIFTAARMIPLAQAEAFQAIYQIFLAKDRGPKAGNLLPFLDRSFVIERCQALAFSRDQLLHEIAQPAEIVLQWLADHLATVQSLRIHLELHLLRGDDFISPEASYQVSKGIIHCRIASQEGIMHRAILFASNAGLLINPLHESKLFQNSAIALLDNLRQQVADTLVEEEVKIGFEHNGQQLAIYQTAT
ncbi:lysine--tRNA ligase [Candidatus Magnetaquicoccus inordinatus]|uniref:lysine--tRNA ligase n=1 Tax=Candidatus Magnetaquicoccus inordinatus TaxID=2496818 RepID=UPI00102B3122|nr:lysine--tRNA ligase [Candidatus Magnetaquicoccus inordinatus]